MTVWGLCCTAEVLRPAGAAWSKGLGCCPTSPCKARGFVHTKTLLAAPMVVPRRTAYKEDECPDGTDRHRLFQADERRTDDPAAGVQQILHVEAPHKGRDAGQAPPLIICPVPYRRNAAAAGWENVHHWFLCKPALGGKDRQLPRPSAHPSATEQVLAGTSRSPFSASAETKV